MPTFQVGGSLEEPLCALQISGQGSTCGAAIWRCYSAYPSANGPTPSPTRLSGSCDAASSRKKRMIPLDQPRKAAWPYDQTVFRNRRRLVARPGLTTRRYISFEGGKRPLRE